MLLTPFNNPAPAAFVIETPVDQILDLFGVTVASRVIEDPRTDSESKKDLFDDRPLPTESERLFEGMGALRDFEIGEGGGGDLKRSEDLVGVGIRERWGIDSLELEGECFEPVA